MFKINVEHTPIDRRRKALYRRNTPQVGCKRERSLSLRICDAAVVQRLLPCPVSRQSERAVFKIEESEREHAAAQLQSPFHTEPFARLDQHLRVAGAAEASTPSGVRKRPLHLVAVIDFAVIDDHGSPGRRDKRLRSRRGEVPDCKALMAQHHAAILRDPGPVRVRSPMCHPRLHPLDILPPVRAETDKSGYSAH